jgi:uncharacterized membrane protein AbrB (regulator of aidB expression)
VVAAILTTIVLLLACSGIGLAVSFGAGIPWDTMLLAAAPGSVTEMALTAEVMHANAAVVTAFHIVRIFTILAAARRIFVLVRRVAGDLSVQTGDESVSADDGPPERRSPDHAS